MISVRVAGIIGFLAGVGQAAAVWPDCVVVILKACELLPRMGERGEQRLIEQLVTKAFVEALDEGVLLRLAGRDVMPFRAIPHLKIHA